ncbi:MAG: 2Fe-2S iron-sulfur cluster-binding protein [Myxococcaceae bacterium]
MSTQDPKSTPASAAAAAAAAPAPAAPAKPAPKNPGFVTFSMDGKEIVAKPGTNMIEAARENGLDIPFYCYHPRLSIAANCRMCLVEASNAPKLVPACQTPIAEGIAVQTQNTKVRESQRAVMEFLLLNHPVDCAICDQAGECKLQDYYMRYDHRPSRLEGRKVQKDKRKVLGPTVVLDQERCILCTRCVRFMDEVAKEPQLGVFGRGSHEVIDTFPGQALSSNYAGNTVDICPVGALLNRDFRFRARSWFLSAAPSVCTGCSRGCSIFADFMGQDTYRYRPRENDAVNKGWMCDQGRASYKSLNTGRILNARIGRGAEAHEATGAEALDWLMPKLKEAKKVAVAVSPLASNEDLLAALSFAKQGLRVSEVYVTGRTAGQADHFLMTADKNPNRKGLEWIAKAMGLALRTFDELDKALRANSFGALYMVGAEVPADAAALANHLASLELLAIQATNDSPLLAHADVVLPASTHVEDDGSFTNLDGLTQRFRRAYPVRGDSAPHWRWASELSRRMLGAQGFSSARDVFRAHAPAVSELAAFAWDASAPAIPKKGISTMTAAADGRVPGYREVGVPRVRGI